MDSPSPSIFSTRDERIAYARNLDRRIVGVLEFHERGANEFSRTAYIVNRSGRAFPFVLNNSKWKEPPQMYAQWLDFGAYTYSSESKCVSPFRVEIEAVHWRKSKQNAAESKGGRRSAEGARFLQERTLTHANGSRKKGWTCPSAFLTCRLGKIGC